MNSSPSMILSQITGEHATVPDERYPRLVTDSWLARFPATALGTTRRGRPPPDAAARVWSTFALFVALWLSLAIQCMAG